MTTNIHNSLFLIHNSAVVPPDITQLEKIPPQSIEAEMSLLGSVLLDKDAMLKIADIVQPANF
jgi:hypothetical protein